ncbi:MAG: type II toxin-antitoxin system VapC family toxin [Steroidobacteraceae bacterium]
MKVLLDTHMWLWWLSRHAEMSDRERNALDRTAEAQQLFLAAISLWEAQMLHSKKRIQLPVPFADWLRRACGPGVLQILPLDAEVVIALDSLPRNFHGDPADRLIAATARAHRLPLATHDGYIRRSRAVRLWNAGGRERGRRRDEV